MRLGLVVFVLTLLSAPVFAQDGEPEALPEALTALLAAAGESSDEDFADAVRLIALTEDPLALADAAARLGAARGSQAREILGLSAVAPDAPGGLAGPLEVEPAADIEDDTARVLAAPWRAPRVMLAGQSEALEGRASLGLRFDGGNSDRQDYTLGLSVKRALEVWGFETGLSYAYSEVDGAVGRDTFEADARLERAAGETWTFFTNAEYEQDALSGFDYTALVAAGAGYRVYDRPALAWVLRAAPGARIVSPATGDTVADPALELSSDFEWQVSEAVRFTADTSALVSDSSRAEQTLTLDTALGEVWSLALKYQYTYEFDPGPGFENADTRTDVTLVRLF